MSEQTQSAEVQLGFPIEGKSIEDDDLIVEGLIADWQLDRMEEAFEPGAFDAGMKSFMESNPVVLYHHKYDKALGQVLEVKKLDEGWWAKARIDKPAAGSWAEDVYQKIKRGTIRAFSVGGRWSRRPGPDGKPRIYKADMAELSVTPLPVNQRTLFSLAGKAFGTDDPDADSAANERAVSALERIFERLAAK